MSCFDVQILDPNINTIEIETCIGDQPSSIDILTYDNTSIVEINHCVPLLSEIVDILPVQDILAGSGISVSDNSGIYTVSLLDPTININDIVGFLESVQDIIGQSGLIAGNYISINYDDNTGFTTVSSTGLQPSGNYSVVGHTHTSSDITNFDSAVSGLIPPANFTSLTGVSGIVVTNSGTNYFVSLSDPTIQLSDITDLSINARTFLLTPSSNNLQTLISDETGSGTLIFNNSPAFSGTPTVPTAPSGTNTTQIASTAFVRTEISNLIDSAPSTLDTLNELAAALGDDPNFATTITNTLTGKANLSGAIFTGPVTIPSGTGNFNNLTINGINVSISGHTHTSSDITNFNSSVSGLLPNITGTGYVTSSFAGNTYIIGVTGLQPSGNYSLVGHNHTSSDISDFTTSVSGLIPVKNISGSGYVNVSSSSGNFIVSVTGLQPSGNYSLVGHTHGADEIYVNQDGTYFSEDYLWIVINSLDQAISSVATNSAQLLHSHGNISSSGAIGSTSGLLVITGSSGVLTTSSGISSSYISDFNSSVSGLLPTINNSGNNRLLTSNGTATGIDAESNLTFDGGDLKILNSNPNLVIENISDTDYAPKIYFVVNEDTGLIIGHYNQNSPEALQAGNISQIRCYGDELSLRGNTVSISSDLGQTVVGPSLRVDNVIIDSNIISTTSLNNNLIISPTGTGKVGIKNNSPAYTLDVSGSGNFASGLFVNNIPVSVSGHTHSSSDITNFNSSVSGLLPTINNSGNNRVLTSTGSSFGIDAESYLTFNNNTLTIGSINNPNASIINIYNNNQDDDIAGLRVLNTNNIQKLLIASQGDEKSNYILNNEYDFYIFAGTESIYLKDRRNDPGVSGVYIQTSNNLFINNIPVSVSGHNHLSSDITNFNSSVSGLLFPYALLDSPSFTGTPTVPTANSGTNTTQIASTAFVRTEISNLVNSAPATLDTLNELASALGDDPNFATTIASGLSQKSNIGHTHTSSEITDFNNSVSGLLPVKDITSGTGISVSSISGIYTINSTISGVTESAALVTNVFNKTASTIAKGSVVYINGGQGDQPTIQLAIASGESGSSKTYGIVQNNIASMSPGKVVVAGALTGFNTDQYNPTAPQGDINGTTLWLSPTISGAMTTTKPYAPYHMVSVGTVVRTHQNEGVVEVRVQNGFELEELHNVAISGAVNGQFLQYNSTSGLWVPSSSGNFTTLQVNGTGVVASSGGNSGYLSKFTASNTIDNSIIYQSSGNIGINTTNPSYQLDVSGSIRTFRSDANEFLYYERSGTGNGGLAISAGATTFRSTLPYRFFVGANEHVRIDSSGNVGIGTGNPSYKLDVIGTGNFSQNLLVNGTGVSLVGHTHTSSNITDFNSSVSGLLPTISNSGDNRLLTSTGSSVGIDAESNLTFDGSTLNIDGNLVFDSFTESVVTIGNSSTSQTLSLASGTVQTCTLTDNCTFTMPTTTAGKSFTMFLNSGSGNYTASFSGVLWNDSAPPTITTTPSKVDILSFISDGTYWYGSYSQNYG